MIKFSSRSTTKQIAIMCGLLLIAFLVGSLVGYVRGALGDDGGTEQTINWAVKTGLSGVLLIVISTIFGKIAAFIESKLKLAFFVSFAITMGFVFAVMDGSGVLMKIESGKLWLSMLSGFVQGVLVGGIGGILIQKTQNKIVLDNSIVDKADS